MWEEAPELTKLMSVVDLTEEDVPSFLWYKSGVTMKWVEHNK